MSDIILPPEIIQIILKKSELKDMLRYTQVSKLWRLLVEDVFNTRHKKYPPPSKEIREFYYKDPWVYPYWNQFTIFIRDLGIQNLINQMKKNEENKNFLIEMHSKERMQMLRVLKEKEKEVEHKSIVYDYQRKINDCMLPRNNNNYSDNNYMFSPLN